MENNMFKSGVLLFALGSMSCISLWAQGTVEDYNRAYALREKYNAKHVLYAGVVPHWVDQTSAFWYVRQTEKGKEYVKVDAASKKRTALFDQQKMAAALTEKAGREINAYNLPLQNCRLNISLDTLRFQLDGKFWAYSIKNNRLLDEGAIPLRGKERHWMEVDDEKEGRPVTSPDGKWTAFIKNDNVYVREVATGKEKQLSQDGTLSNYYSSYIQWSPDSKSVVSCRIRPVEKRYVYYVESSPADQAQPKLHKQEYIYRNYLSDGKRIIWSSERDNYNHLYLYDRATGKPLNQITKGEWYVRGVQHVDEANEVIYFSANGMKKGEDPYLIHYYKINFDGSNLVELTPEEGMHQCWYSSDYKYLVDVYSKVDQAPIAVLRDAKNGKIRMQLDKADISALLANGWKAPEVFSAKGRDGKTDMWGVIYRPSNFDPSKKYPVIEYIYSGPGDQYVPKTFSSYNWWMTSLAELGFIVVQVDGMTTSFRSKEFEEVCYKNLKDAGLPDHIAWIKAAAQKYPYMDIDRVGIFGCSAGGQESTGAVLFHPEFYKAAYSACGCHDNRMDKIWWNELWMGYPVDESYSACSNVDNAHLLSRPLMLVVGELDDNVDPASTMQVVNALIKANKDFELVVIPGAHHTMGEDFGEHKRYDFFVRHLMGITPPSWDKVKTGK